MFEWLRNVFRYERTLKEFDKTFPVTKKKKGGKVDIILTNHALKYRNHGDYIGDIIGPPPIYIKARTADRYLTGLCYLRKGRAVSYPSWECYALANPVGKYRFVRIGHGAPRLLKRMSRKPKVAGIVTEVKRGWATIQVYGTTRMKMK